METSCCLTFIGRQLRAMKTNPFDADHRAA